MSAYCNTVNAYYNHVPLKPITKSKLRLTLDGVCVICRLLRGVSEVLALLRCYALLIGNLSN
jgi:hypothetical protein